MHRPRPRPAEYREGPCQHLWEGLGIEQGVAEARHAADHLLLAGQLMQPALAAAQGVAAVDAGDHQHWHRVGQRLAHGGGDIGHAGPGDDQAHPGLAAGAGVAVGHEAGALFVARRDVLHAAALEAAVELHGVHAGNSEQGVDPVGIAQQANQQLGAGHGGVSHRVCLRRRRYAP